MAPAEDTSTPELIKIEQLLMPFTRNAALFPVAFALFGHVSIIVAVAVLAAAREASVAAMLALCVFTVGTLWLALREWRRRGRPAGISLILALTWAGAFLCAWAADRSGAF